ncbi:hypothetical protein GQ457_12G014830 [Hibiscus cannabinus]
MRILLTKSTKVDAKLSLNLEIGCGYTRKERFPNHRKTKLDPRGDGPFQVLERINNNSYKIDIPSEYNVSTSFNVSDISPFDVSDSWTNPFEEGGDDTCTID